jgi:replicative superfamily II helicase
VKTPEQVDKEWNAKRITFHAEDRSRTYSAEVFEKIANALRSGSDRMNTKSGGMMFFDPNACKMLKDRLLDFRRASAEKLSLNETETLIREFFEPDNLARFESIKEAAAALPAIIQLVEGYDEGAELPVIQHREAAPPPNVVTLREYSGEPIPTSIVPQFGYKFPTFNPAQSMAVPYREEDVNVVCAFPTGAGKTVVAELLMEHAIRSGKKAIYTAPLKALSQEKQDDWKKESHLFSKYKVSIITGDYRLTAARVDELRAADIIVLTSEMLDSRCRRMTDEKNDWLLNVGVCVIDEAHLLTVDDRGDRLESGLMRFTLFNPSARLLFLSATVSNSEELAGWAASLNKKKTMHLRSSFRPVTLKQHFVQYINSRNYHVSEKNKLEAAIAVAKKNPDDHILFFVHSKKAGHKLLGMLNDITPSAAFHNASAPKQERLAIEEGFREKRLKYLVSTSTLAWGVNLPARRVVIVGMHRGLNEVAMVDILQEAGRAGRPGLDTEGDAYFIIPASDAKHYERMIKTEPAVTSRMCQVPILVSGIRENEVKTDEHIADWYSRSFAYFQGTALDENFVEEVTDQLKSIRAVEVVDGHYRCLPTGDAAAKFYYSPIGLADWRENFRKVFTIAQSSGKLPGDYSIAWALGHLWSDRNEFRCPEELNTVASELSLKYRQNGMTFDDRFTALVHGLLERLEGRKVPEGSFAMVWPVIEDVERMFTAIREVGERTTYYVAPTEWWDMYLLRLSKGVSRDGAKLAQIPKIGPARAANLIEVGVRSLQDVITMGDRVKAVLGPNLGDEVYQWVLAKLRAEAPKAQAAPTPEPAADQKTDWGVGRMFQKKE